MTGRSSKASSPGKFILLGEHAVVYGKPAVALAIDRRFRCKVSPSNGNYLNGMPIDLERHPHIEHLLSRNRVNNVSIETESDIPSSSGLGSSGALSSSLSAALKDLSNKVFDRKEIAEESFGAEYYAQGRASPLDTSCCTFGKGVALNCPDEYGKKLMSIEKNGNRWDINEISVPKMTFVVGYTGIKAPTGPLVDKVRKYKEHNRFASDIIDEIGNVTLEGVSLMRRNDVEQLGRKMTENHKLLSILGVSCNELNKLVDASLNYSYGAKLTGSGGGGSMIALTDQPEKVCEAISIRGGVPIVVNTGAEGVKIEE